MPSRGATTPMVHMVVGGTHITPWGRSGLRHVTITPIGVLMGMSPMVLWLQVMLLLMVVLLLLLLLMVLLLRGVVGGRAYIGARRHLAL